MIGYINELPAFVDEFRVNAAEQRRAERERQRQLTIRTWQAAADRYELDLYEVEFDEVQP